MKNTVIIILLLSTLTSCTSIPNTRILFVAGTSLDGVSTIAALNSRGVKELNPVVKLNPIVMLITISVAVMVLAEYLIHEGDDKSAKILYTVSAVAHLLAGVWNIGQISKLHYRK